MCTDYEGNYDDFRRVSAARAAEEPGEDSPQVDAPSGGAPAKGKEARRREAQRREEFRRQTAPLRDEVAALEGRIHAAEARLEEVEAGLADPAVYGDGVRTATLSRERASLGEEMERLTQRWEEAAMELETLEERLREEPA